MECKTAFDKKDPFQRHYLVLDNKWYILIPERLYDSIKEHEPPEQPRDSKGRFIKRRYSDAI